MALIGRTFIVVFAFLLASLAAAIVLTIGVTLPLWRDLFPPEIEHGVFTAVAGVGMVLVFGFSLLPAMIVIALAEAFRLRSFLFYAAAGGLGLLALYYGVSFADRVAAPSASREWEIIAAAGIAAGLVYWLLAGRNAGVWCERAPPAT